MISRVFFTLGQSYSRLSSKCTTFSCETKKQLTLQNTATFWPNIRAFTNQTYCISAPNSCKYKAKPAYPSSMTPDPGCKALHVALSVPCQTLSSGCCDDSSRRVHSDGEATQCRANRGIKGRFLALTGVSVEEFGKGWVGEPSEGGAKEWVCAYLEQSTAIKKIMRNNDKQTKNKIFF